jgi:uncharacterized protein
MRRPPPFDFKKWNKELVCPGSRTELIQDGDGLVCIDAECRLRYAIRDEIPIMLVDEAKKLSPDEWGDVMQRHARDRKTGHTQGPC